MLKTSLVPSGGGGGGGGGGEKGMLDGAEGGLCIRILHVQPEGGIR